MVDLKDFWDDNKNKKYRKSKLALNKRSRRKLFASVLVVILFIGVGIGINWPRGEEEVGFLSFLKNSPEEVDLPKVILGEQTTSDNNGELDAKVRAASGLRVLSANLIGIYSNSGAEKTQMGRMEADKTDKESTGEAEATGSSAVRAAPQRQLAGIRILGELKNIGKKKIYNARPIVKFYRISGKKQRLVATKLAAFNESYKFLPLSPGEENVYDVLVANPPSSDSVTIEFETVQRRDNEETEEIFTNLLKITNRELKKESVNNQGQEITYYRFKADLVNPTEDTLVSPGIYVWIKNETGKVMGMGKKIYEADLLIPEATISAQVNVLPVNAGEMFEYEAKTFSKKF